MNEAVSEKTVLMLCYAYMYNYIWYTKNYRIHCNVGSSTHFHAASSVRANLMLSLGLDQ